MNMAYLMPFCVLLHFLTDAMTCYSSASVRPSSGVAVKSQVLVPTNRYERSKGLVVRRVDVPSVMADEIYAPMFAQVRPIINMYIYRE